MILRNGTTGTIIADEVRLARDPLRRALGFLARASVAEYEGLWFPSCRAVHTFGMRAPVDVLFMDAKYRIVQQHAHVAPNRVLIGPRNARHTIELGACMGGARDVMRGDVMRIE